MSKELGQLFRDYREDLDLSQKEVADELHIDRSTYTYYETGKCDPNLKMVKKICDILGIKYTEVFKKI